MSQHPQHHALMARLLNIDTLAERIQEESVPGSIVDVIAKDIVKTSVSARGLLLTSMVDRDRLDCETCKLAARLRTRGETATCSLHPEARS